MGKGKAQVETKPFIPERDEDCLTISLFCSERFYKPSIDSFLLSSFCDYPSERQGCVADICAGSGIVGIFIASKNPLLKVVGIEIQRSLVRMARENIRLNGLVNRVKMVCADIKQGTNCIKKGYFDVVVVNPPYRKEMSGRVSPNRSIAIAKHELLCTFSDIAKLTSHLLKFHGMLYLIHLAERTIEICELLRIHQLEPKKLRFVHSYCQSCAEFVLIKAIKEGNPGAVVDRPLIIYENGKIYTSEVLEIYKTFPTRFLKGYC